MNLYLLDVRQFYCRMVLAQFLRSGGHLLLELDGLARGKATVEQRPAVIRAFI